MDTEFVAGESSSSSNLSYDVFLSFRGEDTRKNFTDHLYSRLGQVGVNTFRDDEEVRKGQAISNELVKAIEQSRVSIVVFSKNYASSSWCLDELVKIVDCRERLNQVVLPIFYDVDPSQVRKQTGCFGEALAEHEKRSIGAERVDKWRAALTEAANLSGLDLRNVSDGHESKFIESIIKQVLQEVNQTPLDVAHYPIGLDSSIDDILLLLQSGCEHEVRMVGICGVGGIGKTTLAKAVYNRIFRQFDDSCFLFDVRSKVEELGLGKLQEKLLHQMLKTKDFEVDNVAKGVNLIKARLRSKKVLIVLDDVDHRSQLESLTRERSWFGFGSVIIITTRDEHLLSGLTAKKLVKLLNKNESQQLFSCHAFNSLSPPQEYVELAQNIINYSGGLPLALVTLGSHLQGRSVEEWRYEFKKLRAIPHCDIQKILQISFDGFDDDTQSVFLDIACAFHGCDEDEVTKTLNACGFYCESAIATLVRRHLLQRDQHRLVMHDLVRDMGREIVRKDSPRDPGKRSRLFNPQEVRDVLQGNKGSENVQVLVVERQALKGVNLSTKAFQKMINLRVLIIDGLHISGDFELLSKELRWLSWKECPLKCIPSTFPAENLVILDMIGSNIQEFGLNLQYCKSLKTLDLSYCKRLRSTPNFRGSRSLETLVLQYCSSLKEIHPSIGNLDRLTDLYLCGCEKITDLPSSICQLESLEYLDISECSSLETLPVDIGGMRSLTSLLALSSGIKQLPGSIEMLRDLEELHVGGRNLEAKRSLSQRRVHRIEFLPFFLSDLTLSYCGFTEADIPMNIGSLSKLTNLNLSGNDFLYLPFDFSKLSSLTSLRLNNCKNLQTLPPMSNLEYLDNLQLRNCKKLVRITGLENLRLIMNIKLLNCTSLQNPFNEGFFSAYALSLPSRRQREYEWLEIYLQCNEIPDWCSNKVTAPSMCFTMPTVHNKEHKFLGMVLWFVCHFCPVHNHHGFDVSVAQKKDVTCLYGWYDSYVLGKHTEVSCVYYTSFVQAPFNGLKIEGGDKITVMGDIYEVTAKSCTEKAGIKKIGIHLLYLDQHGNVTSLPAVVHHSDTDQSKDYKFPSNDVKQLAGGVRGSISNVIGMQSFVQIYSRIRKNIKSKRDKRKRELKVIAVVNPMRNAKRKLRTAEKHKAHKKRIMMAMKMGRWM